MVWLLAAAAAIAALFREWTEAIAILLVLAINTGIGFATELRAVRSMESLRKLGSRSSRVRRDGELKILAAEQVVPGDIVHFESGDVVLFLNLVTDVFPAFALATGEGEEDVLRRPPRDPREPLLGKLQWLFIVASAVLLTAATLATLLIGHQWLGLEGDALVTLSFLTLAFAQLWHVFNMRGAAPGRYAT